MNAEEYLLNIPLWTKKKNTLSEVRQVLAELGHPDRGMRLIHVAGTNGKGSVCAYMTAELMRCGYRVGTFISPHLVNIRERLLRDAQPAGSADFQQAFDDLKPVIDRLVEHGLNHPTFFEYLFYMAMVFYRQHPVDYLILETGLGGRLDTTNVIEHPALTVITSISLEHMQYLGTTLPEIAMEKAGIIKPGCPLVYDDNRPAVSAVICQEATRQGVPVYPVRMPGAEQQSGFAAPYQAMNAALACQALEVLGADLLTLSGGKPAAMLKRLQDVVWPGRMEEAAPDIWLDGAHNAGGIEAFTCAAGQLIRQQNKQPHLLFAAIAEKDYTQMIAMLCRDLPLAQVTIVQLRDSKRADGRALENEFKKYLETAAIHLFTDSEAALCHALGQKTDRDLLFVVGSLYLIGEIKAIMEERNDKL